MQKYFLHFALGLHIILLNIQPARWKSGVCWVVEKLGLMQEPLEQGKLLSDTLQWFLENFGDVLCQLFLYVGSSSILGMSQQEENAYNWCVLQWLMSHLAELVPDYWHCARWFTCIAYEDTWWSKPPLTEFILPLHLLQTGLLSILLCKLITSWLPPI